MITQEELVRLANLHEPEASASPPGFRLATCVVCKRPMVAMYHLWLNEGGFKKEIHCCCDCARDYGIAPSDEEVAKLEQELTEALNGVAWLIENRHIAHDWPVYE